MRNAIALSRRINCLQFGAIATKTFVSRKYTMGSITTDSAGANGKINSWQGLGAAEFDLRSQSTRKRLAYDLQYELMHVKIRRYNDEANTINARRHNADHPS